MRLKLLRNLGLPLVKELNLYKEGTSDQNAFTENSVVEVEKAVADRLLRDKLAEETTEPVGPAVVRGVAQPTLVQGVPNADFNNPPAAASNVGDGSDAPGVSEAEDAIKRKK